MDTQSIEDTRGPGKNKHKWTDIEDEKLVEAMLELINSGSQYKTDNGFKPGFYLAIEKALTIVFPNSGIKAKSHIESRIKTLKTDCATIHDMLVGDTTSRFGWDYNNGCLEASQSVWGMYISWWAQNKATK